MPLLGLMLVFCGGVEFRLGTEIDAIFVLGGVVDRGVIFVASTVVSS